jgi:hypothetical protein
MGDFNKIEGGEGVNSLGAIGRHDSERKKTASCAHGISMNFCLLLACNSYKVSCALWL